MMNCMIWASFVAVVAYRFGRNVGKGDERARWRNWTECNSPRDACVRLHNLKFSEDKHNSNIDAIMKQVDAIGANYEQR